MGYVQNYKQLIVWQKSMQLVKEVFPLTSLFPRSELYGIIAQIRRCSVSIPSNIAEGYGRKSPREYYQSISIALGSAMELETQLLIAKELKFAKAEEFLQAESLLNEVLKMLNAMSVKVRKIRNSS